MNMVFTWLEKNYIKLLYIMGEITHTALYSDEIQCKIPCKFILYENMYKIRSIDELLPRTLILYQLARVGHFCCIFINDEGLNFFDPLGYAVDEQLKLTSPERRKRLHHDFPYLTKLISDAGLNIIYNNDRLQAKGTSVCGHWCTIRMLLSYLTDDEFCDKFLKYKNRDEIVARMFYSL